jgi:hypothetical protein
MTKTARGPTVTVEMDLPACRAALNSHAGFMIEQDRVLCVHRGAWFTNYIANAWIGPSRFALRREVPDGEDPPEHMADDFIRSAMLTVRQLHEATSAILADVDGTGFTVGPGPADLEIGAPDRSPTPGGLPSLIVGETPGLTDG